MTSLFLSALPLVLVSAAAIVAAFALEEESSLQGWAVATLGTLGLALAMLGRTTHLLDLATVVGVVLFAGILGAGWNPRGRRMLLVLGFVSLVAGLLPHIGAVLTTGSTGAVLGGTSLSWAVARSAGFVAFLSATGAIVLGARRRAHLPVRGLPARLYALHRGLGVTAILALAVHLISLRLDTFVSFSWTQLLLAPWTSSYRPFAVTIGFLAMVSLILSAGSGGLRRILPGWRLVHAASYVTFGLGTIHGLLAGSDTGSLAAVFLYSVALLAVGATLLRRFFPGQFGRGAGLHKKPEGRFRTMTWP